MKSRLRTERAGFFLVTRSKRVGSLRRAGSPITVAHSMPMEKKYLWTFSLYGLTVWSLLFCVGPLHGHTPAGTQLGFELGLSYFRPRLEEHCIRNYTFLSQQIIVISTKSMKFCHPFFEFTLELWYILILTCGLEHLFFIYINKQPKQHFKSIHTALSSTHDSLVTLSAKLTVSAAQQWFDTLMLRSVWHVAAR